MREAFALGGGIPASHRASHEQHAGPHDARHEPLLLIDSAFPREPDSHSPDQSQSGLVVELHPLASFDQAPRRLAESRRAFKQIPLPRRLAAEPAHFRFLRRIPIQTTTPESVTVREKRTRRQSLKHSKSSCEPVCGRPSHPLATTSLDSSPDPPPALNQPHLAKDFFRHARVRHRPSKA